MLFANNSWCGTYHSLGSSLWYVSYVLSVEVPESLTVYRVDSSSVVLYNDLSLAS